MLMAAKNAIVSLLLNFRIRMFVRRRSKTLEIEYLTYSLFNLHILYIFIYIFFTYFTYNTHFSTSYFKECGFWLFYI